MGRERIGLRIATGTVLGLAVLMFLMRLFSSSYSTEHGVGKAYLQGKYSLGGCSEFSTGSQFFLGLLFYTPVFFLALALLLSTFMTLSTVFGESKVLGFSASTVLLAIGAVGIGGLFIMPANASRVVYSVEIAPVLRAQLQTSTKGQAGTFEDEGGHHFRQTKEWVDEQIKGAEATGAADYTYAFFSLKFFGWYLYLLAYTFCILLSFKVLELLPEDEEEEDEESPKDPEVESVRQSVQRDIDEFNKTIDFDGDFHDFTKDANFGIKTANLCDSSEDEPATKLEAETLVVGKSAHGEQSKSPKSAHVAADMKTAGTLLGKQTAVLKHFNKLKTAFSGRANSVCSEEKQSEVPEQSEKDTVVIEI